VRRADFLVTDGAAVVGDQEPQAYALFVELMGASEPKGVNAIILFPLSLALWLNNLEGL